jgi:diguanylate cyclase (GGDEF)-like protein/PAS domain S-box-containing protein
MHDFDAEHPSSAVSPMIDPDTLLDPFVILEAVRDDAGVIVDFRFRAANKAACRELRLPLSQILQGRVLDLLPFLRASPLHSELAAVVESGQPLILDDWNLPGGLPGGRQIYLDISTVRVDDGLGIAWWDVTGRYVRDRDVAHAERQQRATLDSLLDPLQLLAPVRNDSGDVVDFEYVRVNLATCRYLGRTREQLEGHRLRGLHQDEATEVLFAWSRHVLLTGEPLVLDEQALRLDIGMSRRYDVRAVRVGDAVSVTYRDVTERVTAARRIAEAKERYRLVAENASEMVFQSDVHGRVQWVSPSVQRTMGWAPEQVVGNPIADFVHPDDHERVRGVQQQFLRTGEYVGGTEMRMLTADGQWRWMSVMGRAIVDGGRVVGGVDAVRDIQDAKDAQAALEESEERFRRAMMDAAIGMSVVSVEGRFTRVNRAMCEMVGRPEEELLGMPWQELTYPPDIEADQRLLLEVLAGARDSYRLAKRYVKPDGTIVWSDLTVSAVRDDKREVLYFLSQITDITESVSARDALATSEEHYRLIAENSLDVVFRSTLDGRLEWISPSVTEVTGWQPEQLIGHRLTEYAVPEDVPPGVMDRHDRERIGFQARCRMADGRYRWLDFTSGPVVDEHGAVVSRVGRVRDVTAEREAQEAVRRSEQRFRTAMESAPTGMAVVSLDRRFTEVNPALCRLLGRPEQWLLDHGVGDVLDPPDDDLDRRLRRQILAGVVPSLTRDHQMIRSDGQRVLVEQSIALLRDEAGEPSGYVSQFADVTEAREARDQLRFLATHDSLTELLNRRELVTRVTGLLTRTPRTGVNVGVLFIDLDRLKPINDTYGHAVGDEVIVTVAHRIYDRVRGTDVVARFGGDEFVVVLPAVHSIEDLAQIAANLHACVREPMSIDGQQIQATLSIGAALVPPGSDPDVALKQADAALYRAKREGRDRTVLYDPDYEG